MRTWLVGPLPDGCPRFGALHVAIISVLCACRGVGTPSEAAVDGWVTERELNAIARYLKTHGLGFWADLPPDVGTKREVLDLLVSVALRSQWVGAPDDADVPEEEPLDTFLQMVEEEAAEAALA